MDPHSFHASPSRLQRPPHIVGRSNNHTRQRILEQVPCEPPWPQEDVGFEDLHVLLLPYRAGHPGQRSRGSQVFPEEDEAARLLLNLSQQMPIIVVASSVLDLFLVFLFQKFLHPWRRILAAADTKSESEAMMKLEESASTMRRISFATISQPEEFDATGFENPTNCSSRETVNTDC